MSILGLGFLYFVPDDNQGMFVFFSFVWKFLCGVGAGINSTASFAIIATHYKDQREKTIGMMEAFSGIGLLIGPIFGGIMHQIGGYLLPFLATCKNLIFASLTTFSLALTYFLLYPMIAFTLNKINQLERDKVN